MKSQGGCSFWQAEPGKGRQRRCHQTTKGMIGYSIYSYEESADIEAFVGFRRRVLAPTRWTAGGEA
eukprot:4377263-Prymnesium_polylepis.1